MENLEERVNSLSEDVRERFVSALCTRDFSGPSQNRYEMPYYKYELVERIAKIIEADELFQRNIDSKLNKDELKRVYYGYYSLNQDIPEEIKKSLNPWELVVLYAGIWTDRKQDFRNTPLSQLVQRYIKAGYDLLHKKHMIKFHEGKYIRPLKIPHSQDFHIKKYDKPTDHLNYIRSLLDEEKRILSNPNLRDEEREEKEYDFSERIGITLDSISEEDRRILTKEYGKKALGGYAVN